VAVAFLVSYTGQVQGVGFRYTTRSIADGFDLAGTVRNCQDGSVELFVQGESDEVRAFLDALRRRMEGYIQEAVEREAALAEMRGFHIIR
jgi:acylphosphatase